VVASPRARALETPRAALEEDRMDRAELSVAIITEMGAVFMAELGRVLPQLLRGDLAGIEQRVQACMRVVCGQVVERLATLAEAQGAVGACPHCGGRLWREHAARARQVQGLVGDYRLVRATYRCAGCGRGHIPLDASWGLGPGVLSPGLARVVCRESIVQPFAAAVESVAEALGVPVSAEVARRSTEAIGAVAEAAVQEAMARVAQGAPPWPAGGREDDAPADGVLAVEVDGLSVHCDDGWHEVKQVTVAPVGPDVERDPDTQRERLAWGRASYGAGGEAAAVFWRRAYCEASRRGLGTPAVRTVLCIADAADWIWREAAAYLALPGVELVEIIDLYHAYGYLWRVAQAVWPDDEPAQAAWVEPLKTALYAQGPAPLRTALEALAGPLGVQPGAPSPPQESPAAQAVRRALDYVATHAARLDYPTFVARQFPIGSGAAESAGKGVIQARTKGAGMRWSGAGVQQVIALRTLWQSGRWAAFWRTHPQRTRLLLFPRAPRPSAPCAAPTAVPAPERRVADGVLTEPAAAVPPPRPLRPAADHPWRRLSLHRQYSA